MALVKEPFTRERRASFNYRRLSPRTGSCPSSRSATAVQMQLRFSAGVRAGQSTRNLYRSIWISDFHLGTAVCRASALLDFLRRHHAEKLYLVGDIVDGWNPDSSWCFDLTQKAVAGEIRAWRERGTDVEFLPGNHD